MRNRPPTLWAPWRMEFIAGKREPGCIFCTRIKRRRDRSDLILARGRKAFVILNKYPYNNGHLMVVPKRHTSKLERLTDEERLEMMELVAKSQRVLEKAIRPQGFNVGLNIGRAAGAGILGHLHFHVLPRWNGDTNFVPVFSGDRKSTRLN